MTSSQNTNDTTQAAVPPDHLADEKTPVSSTSEQVIQALRDRPKLSIRMQIYFSFLASFIILCGLTVVHLITIYKLEHKILFLDLSDRFLFEIHQARRYEKNFFLYQTDLDQAIDYVHQAKRILLNNSEQIQGIVGKKNYNVILPHLIKYEDGLHKLTGWDTRNEDTELKQNSKIDEIQVRNHGLQLINFAEDLRQKERSSLDKMIVTSRQIHIFSFIFVFFFIAFIVYILGLRILRPINRFLYYTQRISAGDFSLIAPARRYRDEFSNVAIAINRMIKELDRRQNILIESHKLRAVGTLTAGVAHELNNPINNITLTAHTFIEDYEELDDEEKLELMNDVIHEAERSQKIVKNLLDFARESESRIQSLDIGEVLEETLHLAGNQIKMEGIKTELKVMPMLPRICADKQQLSQVILNLIINALDVSEKNGLIQLMAVPANDPKFIEVKVTDFGPGIPDHILPSIFDPFFTTKGKQGGTGLGLSVSQGIIAKFGGHISVSTQVNKGSTFIVSLPVMSFPANL